jgi:DNA-binding transcriptional ArsR family regulator
MGWWQLSADTLAHSRFVLSPLAETIACLKALHRGTNLGDQAWLAEHLPRYRRRLAADPITAALVAAAFGRAWNADFITPTPTGDTDFVAELRTVSDWPPDRARDALTVSLRGPLPAELQRDDLPARTADLLTWIWTTAIEPDWPRRRRVLEADVIARTARLGQGGWAAALDGMKPGMRWLGQSRLRINMHDYPPREVTGAELLFVPVTPRCHWVSWTGNTRWAVVYPCAGVLAEAGRAAVPAALGRLLGEARAAVLVLLATPLSTTQLVALTGQGLGSVGRHLRVLFDAGLIDRRRAGRSVLYYRTDIGTALVGRTAGPNA